MKAVQANTRRQATASTYRDEVDQACKIILEIDALWRMSYEHGYGEAPAGPSMKEYMIVASPNRREAC